MTYPEVRRDQKLEPIQGRALMNNVVYLPLPTRKARRIKPSTMLVSLIAIGGLVAILFSVFAH